MLQAVTLVAVPRRLACEAALAYWNDSTPMRDLIKSHGSHGLLRWGVHIRQVSARVPLEGPSQPPLVLAHSETPNLTG